MEHCLVLFKLSSKVHGQLLHPRFESTLRPARTSSSGLPASVDTAHAEVLLSYRAVHSATGAEWASLDRGVRAEHTSHAPSPDDTEDRTTALRRHLCQLGADHLGGLSIE